MNQRGRPKKKGAKRPGDLKRGLCRYTFIANKNYIAYIKKIKKTHGFSATDCMNIMLEMFIEDDRILMYMKEKKKISQLLKKGTAQQLPWQEITFKNFLKK